MYSSWYDQLGPTSSRTIVEKIRLDAFCLALLTIRFTFVVVGLDWLNLAQPRCCSSSKPIRNRFPMILLWLVHELLWAANVSASMLTPWPIISWTCRFFPYTWLMTHYDGEESSYQWNLSWVKPVIMGFTQCWSIYYMTRTSHCSIWLCVTVFAKQ